MEKNNLIIYNTVDGKTSVSLLAKESTAWMSQNQLAELFATSVPNMSMHISNIFKEGELERNSVVKDYLTTASDGKNYSVSFYALEMILAIGFRVRSKRGTQFRQWANKNLAEYMVKGFVMDDERLKNPNGKPDYFDELLERIRDIRASEKRFYQKVRDLFMLSSDYDKSDKATQLFFADAQEPNMALTRFKGSIVRKQDIYISKNYLNADELDSLNRFVVVFLETAELRAKNRQEITMDFWRENIDRIIEFNDKKVLQGHGSVSHPKMVKVADAVYETFDANRKVIEAKQADVDDMEELKQIEAKVKKRI